MTDELYIFYGGGGGGDNDDYNDANVLVTANKYEIYMDTYTHYYY